MFGITGYSGAGKTTLIERLLGELAVRSIAASVIKHTHHDFDLDQPGKDSHRMREAGAREVMLVGERRWVLMREEAQSTPDLAHQLERLGDVDLVLVEGFRTAPIPKLEVWRAEHARPPRFAGDASIIAIAVDGAAPQDCTVPVYQLNDTASITQLVFERAVTC
ncbi:hypothetical protein BH09PSE6_BH09PSE6_20420 [soil metagenome]